MEMETYEFKIYVCSCGYKTNHSGNASKHKKTSGDHSITTESKTFVLETDHLRALAEVKTQTAEVINNQTADTINNTDNSTTNITINLVVPEQSVVASIQDAIKSEDCIREIRGADIQEIPAILFKYTRGTMAGQPLIKYDPDKNLVKSKDPVTGKDVSQDLKKFRNNYLAKQTDIYDETFQIPYLPQPVKRDMLAMTTPQFKTGNKKDPPVSPVDVIKICSTGDHRMYKLPHDTKRFYNDVAENVDTEIKQCA